MSEPIRRMMLGFVTVAFTFSTIVFPLSPFDGVVAAPISYENVNASEAWDEYARRSRWSASKFGELAVELHFELSDAKRNYGTKYAVDLLMRGAQEWERLGRQLDQEMEVALLQANADSEMKSLLIWIRMISILVGMVRVATTSSERGGSESADGFIEEENLQSHVSSDSDTDGIRVDVLVGDRMETLIITEDVLGSIEDKDVEDTNLEKRIGPNLELMGDMLKDQRQKLGSSSIVCSVALSGCVPGGRNSVRELASRASSIGPKSLERKLFKEALKYWRILGRGMDIAKIIIGSTHDHYRYEIDPTTPMEGTSPDLDGFRNRGDINFRVIEDMCDFLGCGLEGK